MTTMVSVMVSLPSSLSDHREDIACCCGAAALPKLWTAGLHTAVEGVLPGEAD